MTTPRMQGDVLQQRLILINSNTVSEWAYRQQRPSSYWPCCWFSEIDRGESSNASSFFIIAQQQQELLICQDK